MLLEGHDKPQSLHIVRDAPEEQVVALTAQLPEDRMPREYLNLLDGKERIFALRVCILVWIASDETMVPKAGQLEQALCYLHDRNSILIAGTSFGKTLTIVITILLEDPRDDAIVLVLSPLKRLQKTQCEAIAKFGIPVVAINEDNKLNDKDFTELVYNKKNRKLGSQRCFIVTPEQFFKDPNSNQTPRFGTVATTNTLFNKRIRRVFIDEVHFVVTAGIERNGISPFRPCWGKLDELKQIFPRAATWHGLTATLAPYMLKYMSPIFGSNYKLLRQTTNRKNIMYALHQAVGGTENVRNYECFLTQPYDALKQPRVLLFFQSMKLAAAVSDHLDSLLLPEHQMTGVIEHYYSDMSEEFLERVFAAFTNKQGATRILCSTSGNSTGVDFPDVDIVCVVGLPGTLTDVTQCFGRGGRKQGSHSLALLFYDFWVQDILLHEFEGSGTDLDNPDRTRQPLTTKSKAKDRAVLSCVRLVKLKERECQRRYYAEQHGDESLEAYSYTTAHCCSTHTDNPLSLSTHLPSPLFTVEHLEEEKQKPKEKKARNQYRKPGQREDLDNALIDWVTGIITSPNLEVNHGFRYIEDILSTSNRKRLVMVLPGEKTSSAEAIQTFLQESDEWKSLWGDIVYQLIRDYDESLKTKKRKRTIHSDDSDEDSVSSTDDSLSFEIEQGEGDTESDGPNERRNAG